MRAFWTPALLAMAASALARDAAPDFLAQREPPATHRGYARATAYAPARDGTRLAVTWYLPDGPAGERYPALLWYHPGHRESIDPATGAIRPVMAASDIAYFTSHGYAVAIAEMRGSGASFGSREIDRGPQIEALRRRADAAAQTRHDADGLAVQARPPHPVLARRRRLAELCPASGPFARQQSGGRPCAELDSASRAGALGDHASGGAG